MEGWNKEKVSYLIDFLERLGPHLEGVDDEGRRFE